MERRHRRVGRRLHAGRHRPPQGRTRRGRALAERHDVAARDARSARRRSLHAVCALSRWLDRRRRIHGDPHGCRPGHVGRRWQGETPRAARGLVLGRGTRGLARRQRDRRLRRRRMRHHTPLDRRRQQGDCLGPKAIVLARRARIVGGRRGSRRQPRPGSGGSDSVLVRRCRLARRRLARRRHLRRRRRHGRQHRHARRALARQERARRARHRRGIRRVLRARNLRRRRPRHRQLHPPRAARVGRVRLGQEGRDALGRGRARRRRRDAPRRLAARRGVRHLRLRCDDCRRRTQPVVG